MALAQLVHERLQKPDGNVVRAVVIVAIPRELTLGLEVHGQPLLVTDDLDLRVLDGA